MAELFAAWITEAQLGHTLGALALLVVVILSQRLSSGAHRGVRVLTGSFTLHVAGVLFAGVAAVVGSTLVDEARLIVRVTFAWVALLTCATVMFEVLLPRVGVRMLRLVEDISVAVAAAVVTAMVASRSGYDLTGLFATSAVLTAVVGLALQDTLGNTLGGLTLQFDGTIHVDDWIKVGDVTGRVSEIRWRYTAIESRNWETILIPNSRLVKESVVVLGRRANQPQQWRRWVWFRVDFRYAPARVIEAVEQAMLGAPIDNVASTPPPNAVLMEYSDSVARYAVRYWLTDLAADDPTDSAVRVRLYAALERAGIPFALPAHAIFMTQDNSKRREHKRKVDHARRLSALQSVQIFAPLSNDERDELADALIHAPFARGEVITRQGQRAHWLYCVLDGDVSVRVAVDGLESEVAVLGPGEVFGEMSLLTGEPRAASAVAITDVECWRLEKEAFQEILRRKPEFAGPIADLLAERRVGLLAAREKLDDRTRGHRLKQEQTDVLARMRRFLGLPA